MAKGKTVEVSLSEAKKALKGYKEIYEVIEFWVGQRGWRLLGQGHKFGLWPPDPGIRLTPPWVRVDGTPSGDVGNAARAIDNACLRMEAAITAAPRDTE